MIKNIWMVFLISSFIMANTFVDKSIKLIWQDNSDVKNIQKDWEGAKKYCTNLSLSGYSDWFLPSVEQLLTITDKTKYSPAVKNGIKNIISGRYWSSSSYLSNSRNGWSVDFKSGRTDGSYLKINKIYVRCARQEQSDTLTFDNFNKIVEQFIKKELQNISKPPSKLNVVKDEFETTKEFNIRVENTKAKQKNIIKKYKKDMVNAKKKAKKRAIKKTLQTVWGKPILSNLKYDADNGYFVSNLKFDVKKDFDKKVAIKVERKYAKDFKKQFYNLKPQAIFDYDGKSITLKDIKIPYKKLSFIAQFTDLSIDDTRVAVNISNEFDTPIDISTNISVFQSSISSFDKSKLRDFKQLDRLLASSSKQRIDRKKWLFIVGIEQYEYTDNISYAKRSADMFKKVMKKKLGIREQNCFTLINQNATGTKIKTNLKKMLTRVKKGDTIYFYYNGHGVPVPSLKYEPFMLTADAEPDYVADEKFFSLKNIYGKLSSSKAKKVVAFVDSCFSGVTDGKAVLKGVAATKMKAKTVNFDKDKMVVLSAGKAYQYSNGYNKKGHRLFSFFIMKNILDGKKDIKSLYKNTKKQTYQTSLEEYGDTRTQEPTIDGNFRMKL